MSCEGSTPITCGAYDSEPPRTNAGAKAKHNRKMRTDSRYVAELPSGIIKNPQIYIAGVDLQINDVVYLVGDIVYPMYDNTHNVCGVVAARGIKGRPVLVAGGEHNRKINAQGR